MERLHCENNTPDIEVLEGQLSVQELLTELGFQWPETGDGEFPGQAAGEQGFSQPALF